MTKAVRLQSFGLENYRAFDEAVAIELRPLTLFFGHNSAGKSALLRALPLIAASVDNSQSGPLALDSRPARGATFSEILCLAVQELFPTTISCLELRGS